MSSPFGQGFGGSGHDPIGIVHQVSQVRIMQERAIAAYRRNIALPDVYVADRQAEQRPVSEVGEDGQAMTPERRAQLMAEAGVKPVFDDQGELTGQEYVQAFDQVIESERIGQSAESNRLPMRVVQPRELQDLMASEVDDSTVASAEGEIHIPGSEATMSGSSHRCVFTTGCQNHGDEQMMRKLVSDAVHHMTSTVGEIAMARMSGLALEVLRRILPYAVDVDSGTGGTFLGMPVQIQDDMGPEVRLMSDPYGKHAGQYATVYLCRQLLSRVQAEQIDTQADTEELETVDDLEGESDD